MIDNEAEGNDSGSDHGFGEDFDDFEEGAVDEDGFGDFDSGFQQPEEQRVEARQPVAMPARIPPSESLFVSSMITETTACAENGLDPDSICLCPTKRADSG